MILNDISPFISVDAIVTKESGNYVHFLTHLNDNLIIPDDWKSIIYTSRYIQQLLALKKIPLKKKFFRIVEPNEEVLITLRDKKTFNVRMFENSGFVGNVMFHFRSKAGTLLTDILYTGPFTQNRTLLLNEHFRECVLRGINQLYIDNTLAHSTVNETIETCGKKIQEIHNKYPDYKIMLNVPPFGYEDLIFSLIKDFKFKIIAGDLLKQIFNFQKCGNIFTSDIKDSQIIVGQEALTIEKIKYRFSRKKITVRFIESNFEIKYNYFENIGFYQIHCCQHPSLFQLYGFIEFVKPYNVVGIYKDMPKLPKFLTDLCQKKPIEYSKELDEQISSLRARICSQESVENINSITCQTLNSYTGPAYLRKQTELPRNMANKRKISQNSLVPIVAVIKPNNAILNTIEEIDDKRIELFDNDSDLSNMSSTELDALLLSDNKASSSVLQKDQNLNKSTSLLQTENVLEGNSQPQPQKSLMEYSITSSSSSDPTITSRYETVNERFRKRKNSRRKKTSERRNLTSIRESAELNESIILLSDNPMSPDPIETPNNSISRMKKRQRRLSRDSSNARLKRSPKVSQFIETNMKTKIFSKQIPYISYSFDED